MHVLQVFGFATMFWELCLAALGLLIVLAFKFPDQGRYYFFFVLFGMLMLLGSIYYSIVFIIKGKPSYANSCEFNNVYKLSRWLMGVEPKIYGLEAYDDKKHCIFVVNHQSFIDVLALSDLWREPSSVIAKHSLRYLGMLGVILHYTKIICIKRSNHAQAIASLRKTAELVKKDKINLFMFPEGTRNDSGKLLPFKKGAFHLAIQAQVPIQPVVISCYNSFLDHKLRRFDRHVPFGVYLLPTIPTAGLVEADAGKLLDQTFEAMSKVHSLTATATQAELGHDQRGRLRTSSDCD